MKPIWFAEPPTRLPQLSAGTGLVRAIGFELTADGDDWLSGRIPIDERTRQPFGLLHGGASVALAETLASVGSFAVVDAGRKACVGLEINANHLRGAREGYATGTARPIHLGRSTHVWDIRILDDDGKALCVSRCTVAVVDRPTEPKETGP